MNAAMKREILAMVGDRRLRIASNAIAASGRRWFARMESSRAVPDRLVRPQVRREPSFPRTARPVRFVLP
jgi:hypothetical protein